MNREHILVVVNDLIQTIGSEVSLAPLIRRVLQRLLFHTAYPAGLVLLDPLPTDDGIRACLAASIGDRALARHSGRILTLPAALVQGEPAPVMDAELIDALPERSRQYGHCLKLPVSGEATILLLAPVAPRDAAQMLGILQPVLANLATAIPLSRSRERYTQSLLSDRDEARAALAATLSSVQEERSFLRCLKNSIPDLIWLKDTEGVYLACNPAFEAMFGATEAQIVGKTDYDFVSPELADFFRARDRDALAANRTLVNEEWVLFASTGRQVLLETLKSPMRDEQGHLIGVLGIARDITERKQMEQELEMHRDRLQELVEARTRELSLAKQEAERANDAKSRFLAAASHDLRQPLAALSLYLAALDGNGTAGGLALLQQMQDCVGSLNKLLGELLDISKLEAGAVKVAVTDFALDDLLASLVAIHAPEAEQKGLELRWVPTSQFARTDALLFRRIVGNFIANAIRYTRQGRVLVGCRRRRGKTWVEVWDTGIGIPADRLDDIFEEFRQLDDGGASQGSGLGLAIAAKSANLLGLEIRVRSRPGRGSLFAISFPAGVAAAPASPVPLLPMSLRIAVVEDHPQVRGALFCAFLGHGHQVVTAASAAQLLEGLEGEAPDVLVTDYHLGGGETGLEVIDKARQAFGQHLPAIVMTGDTDPEIARLLADRGVPVHYKPIDFAALQAGIANLLGYGRDEAGAVTGAGQV